MWLWDSENENERIPEASKDLDITSPQFVNYIKADTYAYAQASDTRAVKKTLTIPNWLNIQAERANAPFSQILQQGLKKYLGLKE